MVVFIENVQNVKGKVWVFHPHKRRPTLNYFSLSVCYIFNIFSSMSCSQTVLFFGNIFCQPQNFWIPVYKCNCTMHCIKSQISCWHQSSEVNRRYNKYKTTELNDYYKNNKIWSTMTTGQSLTWKWKRERENFCGNWTNALLVVLWSPFISLLVLNLMIRHSSNLKLWCYLHTVYILENVVPDKRAR